MSIVDPADSSADLLGTATLVARARAGDLAAREQLFATFRSRLNALLRARLPAGQRGLLETQDLVQEVALEAVRAFDRFEYRGVGSFWAWLRQIALHKLEDVRRRAGRKPAPFALLDGAFAEPAASEKSPLAKLGEDEEMAAFERALTKLRADHREAVLLRLELGLDYDSIAGQCGFSSAAVARMTVSRAVKQLSQELARDDRFRRSE